MNKKSKSKNVSYYFHLLENSRDILYLINAKTGRFEYISPSATSITGFTPEELNEMGIEGISKRTHPDTQDTIGKLKNLLALNTPLLDIPSLELKVKHKAGHYIWLGINRNLIFNSKGEVESIVGNVRDITETKHLQLNLKSVLDNYKNLYNSARVALFRTKIDDGKVLECNDSMAKLMGYNNREECMNQAFTVQYVDPQHREKMLNLLNAKGQISNFELKAKRNNGELIWLRVSARIYPEKGCLEGALWDITASKVLSQRENKILELVMQGKSSKEIAFRLKRSVRTIEDHRARIMRKLGAQNLVELTKKVLNSGIEQ